MKKLLSILALLLCVVMVFTSCSGKGKDNDDDKNNNENGTLVYDADADIAVFVANWNAAINAEQPEMNYEDMIDTIFSDLLEKYPISLTDVKVDGEELGFAVVLDSEKAYLNIDGTTIYGKYAISDRQFDLLLAADMDGTKNVEAGFVSISLEEIFNELDNMGAEITMPEIKLPELSAEDFKDNGDRTYTLSRDAFDEILEVYIDAVFEAASIEDSEKRETKALINGYLEDVTIDISFGFDADDKPISKIDIDVPEDVYLDIMDTFGSEDFATVAGAIEHDYSLELHLDLTEADGSITFDVEIPTGVYENVDSSYIVKYIDLSGEFNINAVDFLVSDGEKLTAELAFATEIAAYVQSGDAYVVDTTQDFGASNKLLEVEFSYIGEDIKLSVNSDGEHTDLSAKLAIGNVDFPSLDAAFTAYDAKCAELGAKYSSSLAKAEKAIEDALDKIDASKQQDTWGEVSYYDSDAGIYFMVEFSCDEGVILTHKMAASMAFLTDPQSDYFVKDATLYATKAPNTPVVDLLPPNQLG